MELQRKKRKVNHNENSTVHIFTMVWNDGLSDFCLNGVSVDRCQLLWPLRSKKVVGYKVEMAIPDPWILKGGEVLVNAGREVTKSIVEILSVLVNEKAASR